MQVIQKQRRRCFATLFVLLVPALLMSSKAYAQSQFISGTVVDQSGAIIQGAMVKIVNDARKTTVREVTTDISGRFQALNIQPGVYTLTIEAPGFKKLSRSNVALEVNTKLDVGELKLTLGEVADTVQVNEQLPVVQTNTMEKAYLVESKQVQELPLNGRNWVALMSTVPGVTSSTQSDFNTNFNDVSGFHAIGGRGSQNNFYLDGSPNLDVGDNQSQYTQPSIDSIAEFKVQQSSFNAEYGRNSGLVVAVQTKSGGSSFHGTLYEYNRNDLFDARYPTSLKKDVLRYNLFGGNISGWAPLGKFSTKDNKRLFFFYNREMTRRNIVPAGQNFVDIPSARTFANGDFSPFITGAIDSFTGLPVGTVFQPGTVRYNSSGDIIGGTPYPGNIVPTSAWNSQTAAYVKLFTGIPGYSSLPAAPAPGLVRWTFSSPSRLRKNQDLLRVDYNLSNKTTTYFRFVNDDQREFQSGAIWGWNSYGPQLPFAKQERPKPGSSWSWNIVNTISPTLASETILSYNHQSQSLSASDTNGDRDALGANFTQLYPATNTINYLANVRADGNRGFPGFTLAWGSPGWHNDGKDYAFTENLSWVKSSHTMKFGFYYNRDNKKQTANFGSAQGEISFYGGPTNPGDTGSNLANMLLGNLSSYNQANASIYPYFRFQSWEGYAQDSWKVNHKLTLEYGLRFQRTTPTYTYTRSGTPGGEGTFQLYSVDLAQYSAAKAPKLDLNNNGLIIGDALAQLTANGLIADPASGVKRGFADTKNFASPRFGFAYDIFGDGKTAVRGGFGQYVERLRQNNFNFGAGNQYPNGGGFGVFNINARNITPGPTGSVSTAQIAPPGYNIFPVGNTMPTIYSWNLGVQRDLGRNFALDVSYVGNHGTHLMVQRAVNGSAPGLLLQPGVLSSVNNQTNALRPYRGYGSLTSIETSGTSSYNGMLARLSRRFINGFHFNVNYTWSKTMDIVDNDSDNLAFPLDIRRNWAPAGYDSTHSLTVDYVYELPKVKGMMDSAISRALLNGWQISGITHYQSGFPLAVGGGGDLKGIDAGTQYADLVGDPYAGQTRGHWLNAAAFRRPQDGQYGSLGRHALRGPGYGNWDASLSRVIKIKERANLKIGLDVFNLFNHPQLWGTNTGFGADNPGGGANVGTLANFGSVTSYRDARVLQWGFKFTF